MSWLTTTPNDVAKKKGMADANAGKVMKTDPHWPPAMREAYRAAYNRAAQNKGRS